MGIREDFWGPQQARSGAALIDSNPKAQADERAAELGIQLEPGDGPVNAPDGRVYQAPRYVITPKIVNPGPADMSASAQLAKRLEFAEAHVTSREEALQQATKELAAARAARARDPHEASTLAELQRCLLAVNVATEDHAACAAARDKLKADITSQAKEIAEFDAAVAAAEATALMKALAPALALAEEAGAKLAAAAKLVPAAVAKTLQARSLAEELADQLGITYRDRQVDLPTAMRAVAVAVQKGWRLAGGTGSPRSWLGL